MKKDWGSSNREVTPNPRKKLEKGKKETDPRQANAECRSD